MYPYGLIGNCQCSALVADDGSIDWLCLPRPDSPPVFGALLDPEGGSFRIGPSDEQRGTQRYLYNTNILETKFEAEDGSAFRVLDFCPRFEQYGRTYRPLALFRLVEPLSGHPTLRVTLRPVAGFSKRPMTRSQGNSHLRFDRGPDRMRVATNMSL